MNPAPGFKKYPQHRVETRGQREVGMAERHALGPAGAAACVEHKGYAVGIGRF